MNRRSFLGRSSQAAIGAGIGFNLAAINTLAAAINFAPSDYKCLVCFFFSGGNDSLNMIRPGGALANTFHTARGITGADSKSVIFSESVGANTNSWHAHTNVDALFNGANSLFGQNRLAVLANVGTLVDKIGATNFRFPRGFGSHSDQILNWQTALPLPTDDGAPKGWAGRLLDSVSSANKFSLVSIAGFNVMQQGVTQKAFATSPASSSLNLATAHFNLQRDQMETQKSTNLTDLRSVFKAKYAESSYDALMKDQEFRGVLTANPLTPPSLPSATTIYAPLQSQLIKAAGIIKGFISATGQAKRQIIFVNLGGFDTHGEPNDAYLTAVSRALQDFDTLLGAIPTAREKVVAFTASDFGRTLATSAGGTSHAWGGTHLILGNLKSDGTKKINGDFPNALLPVAGGPTVEVPIYDNQGIWIPTTAIEEYFGTLIRWFLNDALDSNKSASASDFLSVLKGALPNFFVDPSPTAMDIKAGWNTNLGFLA